MNLRSKGRSKTKNGSTLPIPLFQSSTYFLTYCGISPDRNRKIDKRELLDFLLHECSTNKKLPPQKYFLCQQTYQSGEPHFHVILVYPKRKRILFADVFDYENFHPNIQPMRNMKAALQYVHKEDPSPLTNMDLVRQRIVARAKDSSSLYQLLEQQMLKDPFRFDPQVYCARNNIFKEIYKANYSKAIRLIRMAQPAYARLLLLDKPGIRLVTPQLIRERLSPSEVSQFYSHPCYQRIVDHLNQIHRYPNRDPSTRAPLKTRHLLLVGPTDIGKTSLVYHVATPQQPHPGLAHYYATYYLSVGQKYFPPYNSYDYRLVNWQQFTIASDIFPKSGYNRLLNYLDGSVSALPQKGRAPVERQDNPKHILTSNRTLEQHVHKTFRSSQSRKMSLANLSARIDCVVIPPKKSLHFLRKLFVSNT